MRNWIIQLEVSPPFERPHQKGFVVCVQIDVDSDDKVSARFWKQEFQGMDWMQDPPIHELRASPPSELSPAAAVSILNPVRAAMLCMAIPGDFGYIHPTRFKLFIQSGFNSCKLEWVDTLPTEWQSIEPAIEALEAVWNGNGSDA